MMVMKFNCDDCCFDIKLSPEFLSASKKATTLFVVTAIYSI